MDWFERFKDVIAARCAAVTSAGEETPAAATRAARTCDVRSLTGVIVTSLTSITWIMTVILSVPPFPSETDTVTV